jgi:carboxymethylenebutenolidase
MKRAVATDFDQRIHVLYDDYTHGRIDRREFVRRAAALTVAGVTVETLLASLAPNYAFAQQVAADDPRIKSARIEYPSPKGGGTIRGLRVRPANVEGKLPMVLVVHENRGLNPYIEDVARRLAIAGFITLAPDALSPLGGYPGNDDEGRTMQARRDGEEMTQDFIAGAKYLAADPAGNGKVGVVGFCFGGAMANELAVRIPDVISAAVAYYGRQPASESVSKIKVPLLLHYAELDERVNAGWPAYEQALKAADVSYTVHMYPGVNHAFHNDSTPRYDAEAAELSWKRTLQFFEQHLR